MKSMWAMKVFFLFAFLSAKILSAAAVCYEAYLPDHPTCSGYEDHGYTCVENWCASTNPTGNPGTCATAIHGSNALEEATGRCVVTGDVCFDIYFKGETSGSDCSAYKASTGLCSSQGSTDKYYSSSALDACCACGGGDRDASCGREDAIITMGETNIIPRLYASYGVWHELDDLTMVAVEYKSGTCDSLIIETAPDEDSLCMVDRSVQVFQCYFFGLVSMCQNAGYKAAVIVDKDYTASSSSRMVCGSSSDCTIPITIPAFYIDRVDYDVIKDAGNAALSLKCGVGVTRNPTNPPTNSPTPFPTGSPTNSPTPFPTGSPTITNYAGCVDDENWYDRDGPNYDCDWYTGSPSDCADAENYADSNGISAKDACCICGGGTHVAGPPTAPPTTKSPTIATRYPTKYPTSDPTTYPTLTTTRYPTSSNCANIAGWKGKPSTSSSATEYECSYFEPYCHGLKPWTSSSYDISDYEDSSYRSPYYACCACGGGVSGGPTQPPTQYPTSTPPTKYPTSHPTKGNCADDEGWFGGSHGDTDHDCAHFGSYCLGYQEWPYSYPTISHYVDHQGKSAYDACCACGGGTVMGPTQAPTTHAPTLPTASPTESPTTSPTSSPTINIFPELKDDIEAAPTDGTITKIYVSRNAEWLSEVVIK